MKELKGEYHYLFNSSPHQPKWSPGPEEKPGDDEIIIPFPFDAEIEIGVTVVSQELFDLLMAQVNHDTIPYDGPSLVVLPVEFEIRAHQLMRLGYEGSDRPFNVLFKTPIDLLPGDLILLDTHTGKLLAVKRGRGIIYCA